MSVLRFNINYAGWKNLKKNWGFPKIALRSIEYDIAAPVFSGLESIQSLIFSSKRGESSLDNSVIILGYWRSGTTLVHEFLSLDSRYGFPTTYACMNPHHFIMTQSAALASSARQVQRPMDDMLIRSEAPQEDEFALLSLGVRTPYEALLAPQHLSKALSLGDPEDLTREERRQWREKFTQFLQGVALTCGNRPLIIKSPAHGYRVATLRTLLPNARYILIVRDPYTVFESVVGMWHKLAGLYAVGALPTEDAIREAVLNDRPRFEAKLRLGLDGLPADRFQVVRYEDLIADTAEVLHRLYERLNLGDFSFISERVDREISNRKGYQAKNHQISKGWKFRINNEWSELFNKYGYNKSVLE